MTIPPVKASAAELIAAFRTWRAARPILLSKRSRKLATAIDQWELISKVESSFPQAVNSPYQVAAINEIIEALRMWRIMIMGGILPASRRLIRALDQWDRDYFLELCAKQSRQLKTQTT